MQDFFSVLCWATDRSGLACDAMRAAHSSHLHPAATVKLISYNDSQGQRRSHASIIIKPSKQGSHLLQDHLNPYLAAQIYNESQLGETEGRWIWIWGSQVYKSELRPYKEGEDLTLCIQKMKISVS